VNEEEREYLNEMIRSLNNQLVDALRERDEVRRLCCEQAAMDESGYVKHGDMLHFAESRGWDCFKETP